MKNKGWIIVIIILLPSLIWVLLDLSLINSKKLNYFGPKKLASNQKDTIYYSVKDISFYNDKLQLIHLDTNNYKVFIIVFLNPAHIHQDVFRIKQWLNIAHYEPDKIKHIQTILVYPFKPSEKIFNVKDSLNINLDNVQNFYLPDSIFQSTQLKFFIQM